VIRIVIEIGVGIEIEAVVRGESPLRDGDPDFDCDCDFDFDGDGEGWGLCFLRWRFVLADERDIVRMTCSVVGGTRTKAPCHS